MKKSILNIKRFWMLFSTEFIEGIKKNWMSLILVSSFGLIASLIAGIFTMVVTGSFGQWGANLVTRSLLFAIYLIMVGIIFPTKLYAHAYTRRSSDLYLTLPASRLEKYLSMVLNGVFVIPILSIAVYFGLDAILCGVYHLAVGSQELIPGLSIDSYTPLTKVIFMNLEKYFRMAQDSVDMQRLGLENFSLSIVVMQLFFWLEVFLLGSLCFKTNKQAYTLATVLGANIVINSLKSVVGLIFMGEDLVLFSGANIMLLLVIREVVKNAIMLTAIWFRLKNITV